MRLVCWWWAVILVAATGRALAAEGGHHGGMPAQKPSTDGHPAAGAHSLAPALFPMERMGSGTAWQPDATPMFALHRQAGRWNLMFHENTFLLYDQQTGPRGATRVVAPNWAMLMAVRPLGKGELALTGMFSLDPATVRPRGYPELFQTGETFRGRPLVDAQHPHDLFMALSAQYTHPLSRKLGGFLYAAPVGEPALGPVAFPHRLSAWENPFAPLGHHWQDSTHITFGVLTGGLQSERWRLEGSWFNGREPDENRWDFDPIRLDSRSVRLQYLPGAHWHLQVSNGFLRQPEALEPNDVTRTTASVTHTRPRPDGYSSTSFVWGHNDQHQGGSHSDVFSLEGAHQWRQANTLFWRYENADRTELFPEATAELEHHTFNVNAFTLGYTRDLSRGKEWSVGLGGSLTFFAKPDSLDASYGRFPLGFLVFLRIRPSRMSMPAHGEGGPAGH